MDANAAATPHWPPLKSHHLQSSEASRGDSWLFDALGHQSSCSCRQKTKGGQNSKSGERRVTVTDAAPVRGCCFSPPSSRPGPSPIASHYSVTWNQEGEGSKKEKRKRRNPDYLFHLVNESNFLPERTGRACTSVATQNYLTLIWINKTQSNQDSAVAATADFDSTSISRCWGVILCHAHLNSQ